MNPNVNQGLSQWWDTLNATKAKETAQASVEANKTPEELTVGKFMEVAATSTLHGAIAVNAVANQNIGTTATDDAPLNLTIEQLDQLNKNPVYAPYINVIANAKTERELRLAKEKAEINTYLTQTVQNTDSEKLAIGIGFADPANFAIAAAANGVTSAVGKAALIARIANAGLTPAKIGMTAESVAAKLMSKMPQIQKNAILRDITPTGMHTPTLGALQKGIRLPIMVADVAGNVGTNVAFGAADAALRGYEHTEEQIGLEAGMGAFFPILFGGMGKLFARKQDPYLPDMPATQAVDDITNAPGATQHPANPVIYVDETDVASPDLAGIAVHQVKTNAVAVVEGQGPSTGIKRTEVHAFMEDGVTPASDAASKLAASIARNDPSSSAITILESGDIRVETAEGVVLVREVQVSGYNGSLYKNVQVMNTRPNSKVKHFGSWTTLEFDNAIDEALFVLGRELPPADEAALIDFVRQNTGIIDEGEILMLAKTINDKVLDNMPREAMARHTVESFGVSPAGTVKRTVANIDDDADVLLATEIHNQIEGVFSRVEQDIDAFIGKEFPLDIENFRETAALLGIDLAKTDMELVKKILHNEVYARMSKYGTRELVVTVEGGIPVSAKLLLARTMEEIDNALKKYDTQTSKVRVGANGTVQLTRIETGVERIINLDATGVISGKYDALFGEQSLVGGPMNAQVMMRGGAGLAAVVMVAGLLAYQQGDLTEEELMQGLAAGLLPAGAMLGTRPVRTAPLATEIRNLVEYALRADSVKTLKNNVDPRATQETIDLINDIHNGVEGKKIYEFGTSSKKKAVWKEITGKNFKISDITKAISGRANRHLLMGAKEVNIVVDRRENADGKAPLIFKDKDGNLSHVGKLTASNIMPRIPGNKNELLSMAVKMLQNTINLKKINVIQDHFGGEGMFATAIVLANNLKGVIIDHSGMDKASIAKTKWMHKEGHLFLKQFESSGFREVYEKMSEAIRGEGLDSTTPISYMWEAMRGDLATKWVNQVDENGKILKDANKKAIKAPLYSLAQQTAWNRLHKLGLLKEGTYKIVKDKTGKIDNVEPVKFVDGKPVIPETILTEQQKFMFSLMYDMHQQGVKLSDGTGPDIWVERASEAYYFAKASVDYAIENGHVKEYTYTERNSHTKDSWIKSGNNVLALVNPPHFNSGSNIVDYGNTRDLLAHLKKQGNNTLYTDEAWWTRENLIDADKGNEILGEIDVMSDAFVTTPATVGSNRRETLYVNTASRDDPKVRSTLDLMRTVTNEQGIYDQIYKRMTGNELIKVDKDVDPNKGADGKWGVEPILETPEARLANYERRQDVSRGYNITVDNATSRKIGVLESKLELTKSDEVDLANAKRLIDEGVDPDLVLEKYGWYKDNDGFWRKELSDSTVDAALKRATGKKQLKAATNSLTKGLKKEAMKVADEVRALEKAAAKQRKIENALNIEGKKQLMETAAKNLEEAKANPLTTPDKLAELETRAKATKELHEDAVAKKIESDIKMAAYDKEIRELLEKEAKDAEARVTAANAAINQAADNAGQPRPKRTIKAGDTTVTSGGNAAYVDQQWRNNVGRLPDARSGIAAEYIKMGDLPVLKHIPWIKNLRIPIEFTLARKLLGSEAPAAVRSIGAALLTVFAGFSDKSPVGAGADIYKAMMIEKFIGKWVAEYGEGYAKWHKRINGGGNTPIKKANYSTELQRKFAREVMAAKRGDPNADISPEAREVAKSWFASEEALYKELGDIQNELRARGILAEDNNVDAFMKSFEPEPNYAHRMFNYENIMALMHKFGSVDKFKANAEALIMGALLSHNPALNPIKAAMYAKRYVKHMMDSQHNKNIQISMTNKEELMKYMREQNKNLADNEKLMDEDMDALIEILGLQKKGRDIAKRRSPIDEHFEITLEDGTAFKFTDLTINDPALAFGAWAKDLIGFTAMAKASLDFGYDLNSNRIWTQLESKMIDDMADGETIKFVRDIKNFILGDINDNGIFKQTSTAVATLNKLVDLVAGAGYAFGSLGELGAQIGLKSIDRMLRDNSVAMEIITLMRKGEFDKGLAKDLAEMTGVGAGHSNPMMRELIEKGWDDRTQHVLDQVTHDAAKLNLFLAVITGTQLIGQKNMMNTLLQIKQGKAFSAKEMNILKASGYNPAMAERFNTLIAKHTKLNAEGFIESFDFQAALKTDYKAAEELSAFIYRAGKDASTEAAGVGQTPKWVHSNDVGKLMLKLQSAAMLSTSRLRRNMVDFNPDVAFKWAMSMTIASLGYAVRTYMQYYSDQEELDKRLDHKQIIAAGLRNSYMAGLAPNVIDMVFGMIGQDPPFGATSNTGRNTAQVPAQWVIGWLNGAMSTTGKAISGEQLTQDQVRSLLRSPLMAAWVPLAWLNGQFPKEKDINLED